jgi:hypothetical protein
MRTDADDPACVRDPTIELVLSHTATLTCSSMLARPCRTTAQVRHTNAAVGYRRGEPFSAPLPPPARPPG